jgi:transcriptional regulator with XRE-family HTH domain
MDNITDRTDEALLQLIGQRLAQTRLSLNMTQGRLAREAGLGLRTVQRLELGEAATQLSGFVRICRVLGLAEGFNVLIPPLAPSPLAQLKLREKSRKRASGGKAAEPGQVWHWAEGRT